MLAFSYRHPFFTGLLWQCCDQYLGGRYNLNTPWLDGDWIYASDGRRAIRISQSLTGMDLPRFVVDEKIISKPRPRVDFAFDESDWDMGEWMKVERPLSRSLGFDSEIDDGGEVDDRVFFGAGIQIGSLKFNTDFCYWFSLIPGAEWKVDAGKHKLMFKSRECQAMVMAMVTGQ